MAKCPHCKTEVEENKDAPGGVLECSSCGNLFVPPPASKKCPNCQELLDVAAVLCVKCGYDFDKGAFRETELLEPEEKPPLWNRALILFFEIFPGFLKPLLIFLFIACSLLGVFLAYFSLILFLFGVFISGFAVACGALVVYAQGVSFLLSGEFEVLNKSIIEFNEKHWWAFFLIVGAPFFLFFLLIYLAQNAS
jgi:ribosomal protein L37AE/L43A